MPIYEYVCQQCAYRFEVKQSIKDEPLTSCTRCGRAVTKVISAPAIMFKGSGWYITDYSDKMKAPTESANAGETAKDDKAAPTPVPASNSASASPATTPSSEPAGAGAAPAAPASPGPTSSTPPATGSNT